MGDFVKYVALGLFFLILLTSVFSVEYLFSVNGFNGMIVENSEQSSCQDISFQVSAESFVSTEVPIISIKANFLPTFVGDSFIRYTLNESKTNNLWGEDFNCDNNTCWARIYLEKNDLQQQNTLKLCAYVLGQTEKIEILPESNIGFYNAPAFTITSTSPGQVFLGEKVPMKIITTNYGTIDSEVFIQFIENDVRSVLEISSFDIVEGDSSASTIIKAGETKEFDYTIKPTLVSSYNLPYTVLYFTNNFGEQQAVESNHPQLIVIDEAKIEAAIVAEELNSDNSLNFKVILRNKRFSPFEGILKVSPEDKIPNAIMQVILPPNSEKEFSFKTNILPIGNYSLSAVLTDSNSEIKAQPIEVSVTEESTPVEIYFIFFSIIISVGLFIIIYLYWKEK